jgi:hypothetical protein
VTGVNREVRLDQLLGRQVRAGNNRGVGRIEECRADVRGGVCEVTGFVIGVAGLFERLGLGVKLLLGRRGDGYVARWDQLDLSDPERPRLTCRVDELERV